jgi:predicted dehydrogenase
MIWIIGAGAMAREYVKVLNDLGRECLVIGRSKERCDELSRDLGVATIDGGLAPFLSNAPALPEHAIVAVGIEALSETTEALLRYGVRDILLEKPGVGYASEIKGLCALAEAYSAKVFLAYNRRYYASVLKAEELAAADGGVTSFHIEFTEWSHVIGKIPGKRIEELQNWFLGNSTHVIDLAFHLGGKPEKISCYHAGGLDWHPSGSMYTGSGVTRNGALFSYHANWEGPGRWSLDVITRKHRYIFKPLEGLSRQVIGSVAVEPVEIDDSLDKKFKPGLYRMIVDYLSGDRRRLCTLDEQRLMIEKVYSEMSGYPV